jgi:hypothetical protein
MIEIYYKYGLLSEIVVHRTYDISNNFCVNLNEEITIQVSKFPRQIVTEIIPLIKAVPNLNFCRKFNTGFSQKSLLKYLFLLLRLSQLKTEIKFSLTLVEAVGNPALRSGC